jgi:hypothetical protein
VDARWLRRAAPGSSCGGYFAVNWAATGSKAAVVGNHDYGWRARYPVENPQNRFEDFG